MDKIALYIFSPAFLLVTLIIRLFSVDLSVIFLEFNIILFVLFSFISFQRIYKSFINLHNIFLIAFSFFLLSRVLFDALGYKSIQETTFFTTYYFDQEIIFRTLVNIYLALLTFVLASQLYLRLIHFKPDSGDYTGDNNLYRIGLFIYLLCIPLLLLYIYVSVSFIKEQGYLTLHQGETIPYHTFFKLVLTVATVGFFSFVATNPKSSFLYWSFTLIMVVTLMADGKRGPGMTLLLISFWYYIHYKQFRISFTKLTILFSVVFVILIGIGSLRFGGRNLAQVDFSFLGFFHKQGSSVRVISYSIQYDENIHYNLIDLLFGRVEQFVVNVGHRIIGTPADLSLLTRAERYKIYSSYISYVVNSRLYLEGFGIGGSYVAQLFSVGKEFAQIVGGIFFGLFFTYLSQWAYAFSKLKRAFLLLMLPILIYIPRDNMFDFIIDMLLPLLILLVIFTCKQGYEKYPLRKTLSS